MSRMITLPLLVATALAVLQADAACELKATVAHPQPILWRNPTDIRSRNLFYGPGGQRGQPQGQLQFLKEDLDGTNPKFEVRDEAGTKWKVKLGVEAQRKPPRLASCGLSALSPTKIISFLKYK